MNITRSIMCALWLVALFASMAWPMEHYVDVIQERDGDVIPGVTVTVYRAGTLTPASIFSDNGVTAKANPFTNNGNGMYDFYAPNGAYDISFARTGTDFTVTNSLYKTINLFDAAEYVATGQNISTGTSLPAECTVNNIFVDITVAETPVFYICTAPNTFNNLVSVNPSLQSAWAAGKEITGANSLANAVRIGNGTTPICAYADVTLGPRLRPCTASDIRTRILPNYTWGLHDEEATVDMLVVDPDAASPNAMYQFQAGYKPLVSFLVPLNPRGAATGAYESIVSNQPSDYYLTVTDANTDAADFTFDVTGKMAGATTATFRLIGVSKNASPSGNIDLDCAISSYTPGTDTFAAHVTTGEVTALLTPATQNRPVAVTTASHTINGGALVAGDVVYGSCEVDATATTSAQMTDFRLRGWVLVTLSVNSWSD